MAPTALQPSYSPDDSSPYNIGFRLQVLQYVFVACLTVSLRFTRSPFQDLVLVYNNAILQLCVWDWLLALSDEFEMICRSKRRLLHGVYLISRYVIPSIGSTS